MRIIGATLLPFTRTASAVLLFAVVCAAVASDAQTPTTRDHFEWLRFTTENSRLPDNDVRALARTDDDAMWVGTSRGVARIQRGQWQVFTRANSGLPDDNVTALAVAADRAVWIGTELGGVARFDGATWQVFNTSNSQVPGNYIGALAATSDGALWIGGDEVVAKFHRGRWASFSSDTTGLQDDVIALAPMPDGSLWAGGGQARGLRGTFTALGRYQAGRRGGGLSHLTRDRWQLHVASAAGLPSNDIEALLPDADGGLWVATRSGLARLHQDQWALFDSRHSPAAPSDVRALAESADRALWVGTLGGGLARFRRGRWDTFPVEDDGSARGEVRALLPTPDGAIWVATSSGLLRFQRRVDGFTSRTSPLPSDTIRSLAVTADRAVWVGTLSNGLARFDGEEWRLFTTKNSSLPDDGILALAPDPDGAVWIGTGAGVARFDGTTWRAFTTANSGLPHNHVDELAWSVSGELWARAGGSAARFNAGRWNAIPGPTPGQFPDEYPAGVVSTDGTRWALRDGGGLVRVRGGQFDDFPADAHGLPAGRIEAIATGPDGAVWAAYEHGTLVRFDGTYWQLFTTDNAGLPTDRPLALAVASTGTVWIGTQRTGLVRFRPPAGRPEIVDLTGRVDRVTQADQTFKAIVFDSNYRTRPEEFRYEWVSGPVGGLVTRLTGAGPVETVRSPEDARTFAFKENGTYFVEVTAIDRYGYRSQPARHQFVVSLPGTDPLPWRRWSGIALSTGVFYLLLLFPLVATYPRWSPARTAVNSGLFSKFPLLHKSILNSRWSRSYLFDSFVQQQSQRYSGALPARYVPQAVRVGPTADAAIQVDVTTAPDTVGGVLQHLFGAGRRAMIVGRSGTGKSVLLRCLAVACSREFIAGRERRLPVLLDLRTSPLASGRHLEDLIRDQVTGGGVELPDDVLDFIIRKGGLLLLVDSLNEIDEATLKPELHAFLTRDAGNWIVLASQDDFLQRDDVQIDALRSFTPAQARRYLARVTGHNVWNRLPAEARALAKTPKDLEIVADILKRLSPEAVPTRRAALYAALLNEDSVVEQWVAADDARIRAVYAVAFRAIDENRRALAAAELSQWTRAALEAQAPGKPVDPGVIASVVQAVGRSRLFNEEAQQDALGRPRKMIVFQHELIAKFLAARHLRLQLAVPVRDDVLALNGKSRFLEVFYFLIDELESPAVLNAFLEALLERSDDVRVRLVAYALQTKGPLVDEHVRDAYHAVKIKSDLTGSPAA